MIGTIQKPLSGLSPRGPARRGVALIACAVLLCSSSVRPAAAQSSKLHAAFEDSDTNYSAASEPWPGAVRLAAGQQQSAATAAKPVTPPPAPKPVARNASPAVIAETPSPEFMEELPPGPMKAVLPLAGAAPAEGLKLTQDDIDKGLITLIVRDKPLSQVLALLAQTQQLNIVAANDIDVMISITLRKVPIEEALTAVLAVANYTWVKKGNIILITSVADSVNLPADVQGRQIQVFDLDFASAAAVLETIQSFLSPIGKASINLSSPRNNRLTQERVIVEDLPESLARIATYIAQIDRPPRQVLIEAHVLQVTLDDTTQCGVNLSELMRISHSNLTLTTKGFANPDAKQAFLATLDGGDLGGVIEALTTTTDSKNLGSPKLLVLNEQEAWVHVGDSIGYQTSTTTELSVNQAPQFLEVGVTLKLIPRITRDGRVLLHVKPEVSSGEFSIESNAPNKRTSELETDVMLEDGEGMVIGGLIREIDSVTQSKVPYLGNVKGVGWLFRRSEVVKTRVEIIFALVPRIQPYDCTYQAFEQGELVKASVPLWHGPLCRTNRPWDPVLPDGKRVAHPLIPQKHRPKKGYYHNQMPDYVVPPYPMPEQYFYGDEQECESCGPQPGHPPSTDPFAPDQDLSLPKTSDDFSESSHIISDRPIALKRTSGVKK